MPVQDYVYPTNQCWAGIATPRFGIPFMRINVSVVTMRGDVAWHLSTIGNFGIVMNMPFFHMGVWYTENIYKMKVYSV